MAASQGRCAVSAAVLPDASRRTGPVVALLAGAVFLNYFDRGTLATASPLMQGELGLTNAEMGILFSAFFWSYAPLQPLAGWLAQRFDVRYVLGSGLALWALATTLTGFVSSFTAILALRVLLGFGESVTYPCNAKYLGQRVPLAERGRANGFIATGQALGPMLGILLGGLITEHYGWRPAFVLFGLLSLLWLLPWQSVTRDGATAGLVAGGKTVPYAALLRKRSLWGTCLGHFCGNYAYYFMLTWLPLLLVKQHGFSISGMAVIGFCVYALQAVSAPLAGWLCDRAIARGTPAGYVLKTTMNIGLGGVALAMAVCAVAGPKLMVALVVVTGVFFGLQSAPLGTITQTLGGERASAQWMGIQNFCANLAGVLAPLLTGIAVDRSGNFVAAFAIAAGVTLVGILAYVVVIRRVEPEHWSAAEIAAG